MSNTLTQLTTCWASHNQHWVRMCSHMLFQFSIQFVTNFNVLLLLLSIHTKLAQFTYLSWKLLVLVSSGHFLSDSSHTSWVYQQIQGNCDENTQQWDLIQSWSAFELLNTIILAFLRVSVTTCNLWKLNKLDMTAQYRIRFIANTNSGISNRFHVQTLQKGCQFSTTKVIYISSTNGTTRSSKCYYCGFLLCVNQDVWHFSVCSHFGKEHLLAQSLLSLCWIYNIHHQFKGGPTEEGVIPPTTRLPVRQIFNKWSSLCNHSHMWLHYSRTWTKKAFFGSPLIITCESNSCKTCLAWSLLAKVT